MKALLVLLLCSACASVQSATYPRLRPVHFPDHSETKGAWECVQIDDNQPDLTCVFLKTFIDAYEQNKTPHEGNESVRRFSTEGDGYAVEAYR